MRGNFFFLIKIKKYRALYMLLEVLIIFLLNFSVKTIAGNASRETLLLIRGNADFVAANKMGICF